MKLLPHLIDNSRVSLKEILNQVAKDHDTLSIATGYWDIRGTMELIDEIKEYKSVRLLIGNEPLPEMYQKFQNLFSVQERNDFPNQMIKEGIQESTFYGKQENKLRETAIELIKMINEKRLEVRVFKEPRLHAKAYIFGDNSSNNAIGIVGSSNFTYAGLNSNAELNSLTDDSRIVTYEPKGSTQESGHLSWFNELWNDPKAEVWTGDFKKLIRESSLGDLTFGRYDAYIRTLMEVFPEEMINSSPIPEDVKNFLHPFQYENAMSLRRRLEGMGVAMLSDSVGLGKTVTASAVINQFILEGKKNILIIPPASLERQWIEELEGERWELRKNRDFEIVSQQNLGQIDQLIKSSERRKKSNNLFDLIVIDEIKTMDYIQ